MTSAYPRPKRRARSFQVIVVVAGAPELLPGRQLLWDSCITHIRSARAFDPHARDAARRLARNGATWYDPVGIIRPSESVPKKMASVTRRSDTTTREYRHDSMTNSPDLKLSTKDEAR